MFIICVYIQSETEQRPHKVSFYVEKEHAREIMKSLSGSLEKRGVRSNCSYLILFLFINASLSAYNFTLKYLLGFTGNSWM